MPYNRSFNGVNNGSLKLLCNIAVIFIFESSAKSFACDMLYANVTLNPRIYVGKDEHLTWKLAECRLVNDENSSGLEVSTF